MAVQWCDPCTCNRCAACRGRRRRECNRSRMRSYHRGIAGCSLRSCCMGDFRAETGRTAYNKKANADALCLEDWAHRETRWGLCLREAGCANVHRHCSCSSLRSDVRVGSAAATRDDARHHFASTNASVFLVTWSCRLPDLLVSSRFTHAVTCCGHTVPEAYTLY